MSELPVSVEWDRPDGLAHATLLLAHGAGGDLHDPFLRGIGSLLANDGIAVARFNLAYREAGRRAPGAQKQSEDCYRDVATALRNQDTPLFCGGKSYGGRIASHIVADGFNVNGLVLISYPLHPPGRPERLRDAHLRSIDAPMFFCQGTRDPFARPDLFAHAIEPLPHATVMRVDSGDHSLRVRGRKAADVYADVAEAISAFVGTSTLPRPR